MRLDLFERAGKMYQGAVATWLVRPMSFASSKTSPTQRQCAYRLQASDTGQGLEIDICPRDIEMRFDCTVERR